jgi:hypothetical protein
MAKKIPQRQRKMRLYCVACCHKVWEHLNEETRNAVNVAEKYADGKVTLYELYAARDFEVVSHDVWGTFCIPIDYWTCESISDYVDRCLNNNKWSNNLWNHIMSRSQT